MTVQTLTLCGEKYVILRKKDYDALKERKTSAKATRAGRRGRSKVRTVGELRADEMTEQDWGDIAQAKRILAEPGPNIPWSQVKAEAGL